MCSLFRLAKLSIWLGKLKSSTILQKKYVSRFLGLTGMDIKKKKISQEDAIPYFNFTEDMRSMANSIIDEIPIYILSNGEEMFFGPLFDSIKESLNELHIIRERLDNAYGIENKLSHTENSLDRRNVLLSQMFSLQDTFEHCLSDAHILQSPLIYNLLQKCQENIQNASIWANTLDNIVLDEITDHIGVDVNEQLKAYQIEAESLISLYAQLGFEKNDSLDKQVNSLIEDIDEEIDAMANSDQHILGRLTSIREFIKGQYEYNGFSGDYVEQIENVQQRLFELLSNMESLDEDASDNDFQKVSDIIKYLNRDTARIHHQLLREKNEENEDEITARINHVADLQENIGELDYSFRQRYEENSLRNKMNKNLEDIRIKNAQQKNIFIDESLYEL
eukprot:TRINITY_DN6424_c0_g1_i2.p1 TRINITY_DN6424_c0_g1~~TRINITY_DN6424_c0_g1_i2.p1  ORF type:complete len:392 (+),score=95.78 TRINITY_DN6424_c0_g1_i2:364-1539(+)